MRLARIRTDTGTFLARLDGDKAVPLVEEDDRPGLDPLRVLLATGADVSTAAAIGATIDLADATLLSPVRAPQKVVAIGLNYADHARESGTTPPEKPMVFVKTPNSIIGPDEPIVIDPGLTSQVDYEAELAVVMGRRASQVTEADALSHVLGYTLCNDVSARDAQFADVQWVRGKSFDTFCPLGPWITTADEVPDPQALAIRCRVNGDLLQDSTTAEMIFGVAHLISYLSQGITLEPGDVIATGTPFGVGFARTPPIFLRPGDSVEVEVESLGILRNPVVAR
jgi:2-keto-4-pentenoate hydratase/2-oxohepta-3-ene-1,7-dioic acid hydratase in catechol pathway